MPTMTGALKLLWARAVIDLAALSLTPIDTTVAVPGAALGDLCFVSASLTWDVGAIYQAFVSAADVVTIRAIASTGAANPASQTFTVFVLKGVADQFVVP